MAKISRYLMCANCAHARTWSVDPTLFCTAKMVNVSPYYICEDWEEIEVTRQKPGEMKNEK